MFQNRCFRCTGDEFQSFFESIMSAFDPSFVRIKPSGSKGDWKSDGFSMNTGTNYQCYAPERVNARKAVTKVEDDYLGAITHWKAQMKHWTFMCNAPHGLPPDIPNKILEINSVPSNVPASLWEASHLWDKTKNLDYSSRAGILGHVPSPDTVVQTTYTEIDSIINYLSRTYTAPPPYASSTLHLTALHNKIVKNHLNDAVRDLIKLTVPIAAKVGLYLEQHPDPTYASVVTAQLLSIYEQVVSIADDPNLVFMQLARQITPPKDDGTYFTAATGFITHFFELCEIFER